ncbi:hypothetical protein [Subtercola boreus]|uniref:Uncharacterized protein n=1 Tax=Subtercola boreus TaxID=120213 RepID=A0A3E0WFM1_9MICO|nr:hypothetical protein [Subtercola boreus]RFA22637.1 hypothetical protein B7R24_03205 [Subtercola boreus]RFA22993.1 hypothetical protein B7R23_03200 [Subtercola boreus]RFA28744.1 hypothetical protein B7R25_03215 [Subtercola boreus]
MTDFLSPDELSFIDTAHLNYWVGETAPLPGFVTSRDVVDLNRDFRVDSDLHGTFDGVFYVEHDLGDVKQWRQVLDELLHLLNGSGTLVLRYTPFPYFGTHELMNAIRAFTGGAVEVLFARQWPGHPSKVIGLTLSAPARRRSLDLFTFGLIVDGRFPERLTRFVDSVLAIDGLDTIDYEILVCGPAGSTDHIDTRLANIRLVEQDARFSTLGWITRKKNLLVAEARGDLILLAHDRYSVRSDFLTALREYGPDVDVLVPTQLTSDGFTYPSRVATSGTWDLRSLGELEVGDYTPTMYINGGVLIASVDVLRATPYNELLFWAEAEDVELTRRLEAAGVVPRFSQNVVVITDLTRGDQVSVFQRLPFESSYVSPTERGPRYAPGSGLAFGQSTDPAVFARRGVAFPHYWSRSGAGLVWSADHAPEFVIRPEVPESRGNRRWTLTLGFSAGPGGAGSGWAEVLVNGRRAPLAAVDSSSGASLAELTFDVPEDIGIDGRNFAVQLASGMPHGVALRSLRLDVDTPTPELPLTLDLGAEVSRTDATFSGWGEPENWGRWSSGRSCSIHIPIRARRPGATLVVSCDLQAYIPLRTGEQRVIVKIAGIPLDIWSMTSGEFRWHSVRIPAARLTRDWVDLTFEVAFPTSPHEETGEGDVRRLGVGIRTLSIKEARG